MKLRSGKAATGAEPEKGLYLFEHIAPFDARRGYKRCVPPGVGMSSVGGPRATADMWRDGSHNVLVRFSSQGYQFSFSVLQASRQPLRDDQLDAFGDYLTELLGLWLLEAHRVSRSPSRGDRRR